MIPNAAWWTSDSIWIVLRSQDVLASTSTISNPRRRRPAEVRQRRQSIGRTARRPLPTRSSHRMEVASTDAVLSMQIAGPPQWGHCRTARLPGAEPPRPERACRSSAKLSEAMPHQRSCQPPLSHVDGLPRPHSKHDGRPGAATGSVPRQARGLALPSRGACYVDSVENN